MKKLALFACVCIALVFTSGCKREQHAYNASMEYHFAQHDDEVSVRALLGSMSSYWEGDFTWNGNLDWADIQAYTRFGLESAVAIVANFDKIKPFFHEGDYTIYTLTRKEDGKIISQYKFTQEGEEVIQENLK